MKKKEELYKSELSKQKDEYEQKIQDYDNKISEMRKLLENNNSSSSKLLDDVKNEYESKIKELMT